MSFIDAHLHGYFCQHHRQPIADYLASLRARGLDKVFLIIQGDFGLAPATMVKRSSSFVRPYLNADNFVAREHIARWQSIARELGSEDKILYFLNVRWLREGEEEALTHFLPSIQGLKLPYAQPGGRDGPPSVDYLRPALLRFAQSHRLPILIHINTNHFYDRMEKALAAFPDLHFLICHFGFSRRRTAQLLAAFPNAFTDFSALLPWMKKDGEGYRAFLLEHQNQVLLGTDHIVGGPEVPPATEYLDFVLGLGLPREVEEKVLGQNACRFLKENQQGLSQRQPGASQVKCLDSLTS